MTMLRVEDLSVRYGDHTVLDHISFSVREGEWLMIVGPNGAGKSTLIQAVTGALPFSGDVFLRATSIRRMRPKEIASICGVLTQSHDLSYAFRVEEVVRMGRYAHTRFLGRDAMDSDAAVEEALRLTGMEQLRERSVFSLSGGETQRMFLAQLFAQEPSLLLLDEPTNHLDLVYQKQLFALLKRWLETPGRAVVSVVHDLSLARAFGSHALLLQEGRCAACGPVRDALANEHLTGVYETDVAGWMRFLLGQWE